MGAVENNINTGNSSVHYTKNRAEQVEYNLKYAKDIYEGTRKPAYIGGNMKDTRGSVVIEGGDFSLESMYGGGKTPENPIAKNNREAKEKEEAAKAAEEKFRTEDPAGWAKRQKEIQDEKNEIKNKKEAEKAAKAAEAQKNKQKLETGPAAVDRINNGSNNIEDAKAVYNYVCTKYAPFGDNDTSYRKLPEGELDAYLKAKEMIDAKRYKY